MTCSVLSSFRTADLNLLSQGKQLPLYPVRCEVSMRCRLRKTNVNKRATAAVRAGRCRGRLTALIEAVHRCGKFFSSRAQFRFAHGAEFMTRSTYGEEGATLHLDIDPNTHPAWTGGSQQLVDRGGRLSRFNTRFGGLGIGGKK